jgi:autonomous glycyl radical cofactor GrcA
MIDISQLTLNVLTRNTMEDILKREQRLATMNKKVSKKKKNIFLFNYL